MTLAHSLQGSPVWLQEYIQNLVEKSRRQASEEYVPYRKLSREKNEAIKGQIEKLLASQKGSKFDIIPFSVTGTSHPIKVNPEDLRHIIDDEGFARKVYESTTGYHNISKGELRDLRQRAINAFESYLPDITKLEQERGEFHSNLQRLESEREPIVSENRALSGEFRQLDDENRRLDEEGRRLDAEASALQERRRDIQNTDSYASSNYGNWRLGLIPQNQGGSLLRFEQMIPQQYHEKLRNADENYRLIDDRLRQISSDKEELSGRLRAIADTRERIRSRLGEISSARSNLESQINDLKPEDLAKRASIEREINNLRKQTGRIAPMNEIHERAINLLERSFNDDTMQLAADEIRESKKHDELKAVEPLVRSSLEGPSDAYMNKYVDDYTKDIRKALEDESEEEYIKKIAPKINMSFAQMGAFHSGARAKALKDTLLEHRRKLHRDVAHLTASARDKAMEHHELQKRREQSAAGLLGSTTKSERESSKQHAELLRQHAVTKQGLSHMDVAALGQVAKAKQEQEQHELDVERQEYERQLLHPQEQLAREAAFVSGLPSPPIQTLSGSLAASPAPPNLFNLGAGTLASLTSGIGQQPQRQFKTGGSVRKKYASGGPIGSDDIGSEIRKIIHDQDSANQTRMQEAHQYNPFQSWLTHVGKEMLANPSENPLINLGRGISTAMDHKEVMKERAANLYDKIQATKLNQYQVLAAYENMKGQNELRKANFDLHRENALENRKFRQQQMDMQKSALKKAGEAEQSGIVTGFEGHEFIPISSKKEKEEVLKDKKSSESILKDLEDIKRLSKEYEEYNKDLFVSPRSPFIGGIASSVQGKYSNITNNKKMRKAAVTKAALDSKLEKFKINMETKMRKGVLPEGMRQFMEKKEVFPSSHEPLDIYNKKLEDLVEETRNVYDASRFSLKHNIHISPYDLETIKHKSSENLSPTPDPEIIPSSSNGNPWYEQLGGIAAS